MTREFHGVGLDYEPTVEKALDFYPGLARDRIQRAVQVAIDEGEVYDLELPLVNAAGEELWVRTTS